MGREQDLDPQLFLMVDDIYFSNLRKTKHIIGEYHLDKKLNLNDSGRELFELEFASNLLSKESHEISYLSKNPILEVMQKFLKKDLTGNIDIRNKANIVVIRRLNDMILSFKKFHIDDKEIKPSAIHNAANVLTAKYLWCKENNIDFKDNLEVQIKTINDKFFT